MMRIRLLVLLALLASTLAQAQNSRVKKQLGENDQQSPEVELSVGKVQGLWLKTRGGRQIAGFTAIPYGKPPIGDLRFKAPLPADAWEGMRKSVPVEDTPACIQQYEFFTGSQDLYGQEDCLFLNVFTPSVQTNSTIDSFKKLPVMVFIHGGGFTLGKAAIYPPDYLLDKDVVLVVINYRLGALGFLSTEDVEAPGNWGFKDQTLALKWVQDHIQKFGGDPKLVTIFGESAGGISVHLHMVSPLSKGLFHRAISESGTALLPEAVSSKGLLSHRAQRLAKLLNCPKTPTSELVTCLRSKPAMELMEKAIQVKGGDLELGLIWAVALEDNPVPQPGEEPFLTDHPFDVFSHGLAHDVPFLGGVNSADGALFVPGIFLDPRNLELINENIDSILPGLLGYKHTSPNPKEVTDELREFYFGSNNISVNNLQPVIELFTDAVFLAPLDESMRLLAAFQHAPSYYYYFNHRGQRSFSDVFGDPTKDYGVCHVDELFYLFPANKMYEIIPGDLNAEDLQVSKILIDLWVNFAHYGNPTPPGDPAYPQPWKRVQSEDLEFMEIGPKGHLLPGKGLHGRRMHLWASLPLTDRHVDNMRQSAPFPHQTGQNREEL